MLRAEPRAKVKATKDGGTEVVFAHYVWTLSETDADRLNDMPLPLGRPSLAEHRLGESNFRQPWRQTNNSS